MHQASCLCGAVTWEVDGPLQIMSHCHCSRCRKAHGVGFATYVQAEAKDFRLHGAEQIVRWESMPGAYRCFCGQCGSVVPWGASEEQVFLPAGNFLADPGARPLAHIFAASKAPWYEIHDSLACFETYPEGFDAPVLPDRAPMDPPGGVRGSCLCGGVTYVFESQPIRCYNCHCTRCRRARSAAHASNLFVPAEGLRFTRGEDQLRRYKVPDAERFAQVFCTTCGSPMPSVNRVAGFAVVPMGSLDDDPGMRPQAHIFVGSKAPWFDIAGDLPQFAGYPT